MLCARAAAWRLVATRNSIVAPRQCMHAERRLHGTTVVTAAAAQRPSKTAAKVEAKAFQRLARELSRLSEKQLARLEPLVGEGVVDAVGVAASLSIRNQGRQRQESLVARLLRESVEEVEALQAAIESVRTGQGVIANLRVEQQVQLWLAALLAGDAEAATQVFGLATSAGGDLQQMRQLVRQAQQTEAPAPAAGTAAEDEAGTESDASSGSSSSGGSGESAVEAPAAAGGGGPKPTAKALSARKQLRKLLQPLAEARLAEEEGEEEGREER